MAECTTVLPRRTTLLDTCQFFAGLPATPTAMLTGGRQDCGPVRTTRLPRLVFAAVTSRPGSTIGAASSLSAFVDSTDQTTQPLPLAVVVSCGSPPANVPWVLYLTTLACLVSGRLAMARSSH